MFAQDTFYVLCAVIILADVNTADWVDMPQFSDENKIYRIPPAQYDQFYKFRRGDDTDVVFHFSDDRNDSQSRRRLVKITHAAIDKKTEIKEPLSSASLSTQLSNVFRDVQINDDSSGTSKNRATINDNAATENLLSEYGMSSITTTTTTATISKTFTTQSSSTTTHKQNITRDEYCNDTLKQDDTIFQYLPVDILKSVHQTLQSQPASFEGKLHFLKMFEKTLMSEIGERVILRLFTSFFAR
ncbi:uncharacterized protein LOC109852209 [Pseudomyrmex gracilis]|uniref:uncharacterized protein LOC109852209 n=1 Tax=Pseudomyrmex gracilis TaxID=219809 RepID=UPI0009949609|nr:uncharacterized protein LOC109852209 [Pseudomyrmex gracilis]